MHYGVGPGCHTGVRGPNAQPQTGPLELAPEPGSSQAQQLVPPRARHVVVARLAGPCCWLHSDGVSTAGVPVLRGMESWGLGGTGGQGERWGRSKTEGEEAGEEVEATAPSGRHGLLTGICFPGVPREHMPGHSGGREK